jgi:hypothetical protein
MPRGSEPGERRGGRARGTPNRSTVLNDAVLSAATASPNVAPLDFMLGLMRDPKVPTDLRIEMAAAAAPFVHIRPRRHSRRRFDPTEPRTFSETSFRRMDGKLITTTLGSAGGAALTPVDFLLSVMADPGAKTRQRIKAARVAALYKHTPAQPDEMEVDDKFGFKVDPAVARAIRDDKGRLELLWRLGAAAPEGTEEEMAVLKARIAERSSGLECAPGYTRADVYEDRTRLDEFDRKRKSRIRLTKEEDAEQAHLLARAIAYQNGPESRGRSRLEALNDRVLCGEELSAAEQSELDELLERYPGPLAVSMDATIEMFRRKMADKRRS